MTLLTSIVPKVNGAFFLKTMLKGELTYLVARTLLRICFCLQNEA